MSITSFEFFNIIFVRKGTGPWVFGQGEIRNASRRDYNTAAFRLSVSDKNRVIWTGVVKIKGFRKNQTKSFEVFMEGLEFRQIKAIAKYEIYFEGGY